MFQKLVQILMESAKSFLKIFTQVFESFKGVFREIHDFIVHSLIFATNHDISKIFPSSRYNVRDFHHIDIVIHA